MTFSPTLTAGNFRTLSLTFVCVAESASEGAAHSDVSILQVLQHKVLHRDWLPVNLETVALVPSDGAGQNQQLGEQEHMQLLKGNEQQTFKPDVYCYHRSYSGG